MNETITAALSGVGDLIQGDVTDDVLAPDGGNDTIDGGDGTDVADFTGRDLGAARIFGNAESAVVVFDDAVVELRNIETLRFGTTDLSLAGGDALFADPVAVATGQTDGFQYVIDMATGDFNADGQLDLILPLTFHPITMRDNDGLVFLGDGAGGFALAGGSVDNFVTEHARWTVVADFNGDGDDDVFVGDHGFDGDPFPGHQNVLLLSDGSGGLRNASANLPQRNDFTHSAAAGDIDGDGDIDLIAANSGVASAQGTQVLLNDGAGRFTAASGRLPGDFETGAAISYAIDLIDVNGDGAPDLFLGDADGQGAFIALNNGAGSFPTLAALPAPDFGGAGSVRESYDLIGWQANDDGRLDLIVLYVTSQPSFAGGYLQFLRQQPNGSFVDETDARFAQPSASTGPLGYEVELADIDGDGDLDIVMRDPLRILLNQGDNTFVEGPDAPFDLLSNDFVTGDFNGDGALDIAGFTNGDSGDYELKVAFNIGALGDSMALIGGDGIDQQIGAGGADWLDAGAGEDSMWGLAGGDMMFGGAGDDRLFGNRGDDDISGGADDDQVKAHPGDDTVTGGGGNDLLFGGGNDDDMDGGAGSDVVNGNSGFDTVRGGDGDDTVRGQGGRDRLAGGDGDDLVVGMQGFDTLFGGDGNDTLIGGPANDTLTGGAGADTYTFAAGHGANVITDFADGIDKLLVQGASGLADLDIVATADGAQVTLADGGDGLSITLTGIATGQLGATDFLFS
ncbi:MAG: calcium-binding protein [Alphaproteobacteria bacterium]